MKLATFQNLEQNNIIGCFLKDYQFDTFKDRVRYYKNDVSQEIYDELLKMVIIRNCIQHHHSILVEDGLRLIGKNEVRILDDTINPIIFKGGDKVKLSIQELESLRLLCSDFVKGIFIRFGV